MKYSQIAPSHNIHRCPVCLKSLRRLGSYRYPAAGYDNYVLIVGCNGCSVHHYFDVLTTRFISSHVLLKDNLLKLFRSLDSSQTIISQLEWKDNQLLLGKRIFEMNQAINVDLNDLDNIRRKIKMLLTFQ